MNEENEKIVAVYEDARSESNLAVWAIHLQIQRLRSEKNEIEGFVLQPVVDFHFLVTALTRLRKMADLVLKHSDISEAIKQFDNALPDLRKIRNVLEHIDKYRLGEGRNKKVSINGLRTIMLGPDKIQWLDYEIKIEQAAKVSDLLFQSIKDNAPKAYIQKVNEIKRLAEEEKRT
jgi:hypothetical protein